MKTCSKCKLIKEDTEFSSIKNTIRLKSYCKDCGREMCKKYKAKNREKISEYNKKYKEEHKEEVSIYNRKYLEENREKIQENFKNRIKNNPIFRLRLNLSRRVTKMINVRKNRISYNEFIGCSIQQIRDWLEYNFYGDMSWENYGIVWHVDHVIPCIHFDSENDDQVKVCFNWANVQPLLVSHNCSKSGSLYWIELVNHELKLKHYTKKYKLNCDIYLNYLNELQPSNSLFDRNRAKMGNYLGTVVNNNL